jgi:hypothetical protein
MVTLGVYSEEGVGVAIAFKTSAARKNSTICERRMILSKMGKYNSRQT